MKNTKPDDINQICIDYEILDNDCKRADMIRLPVSVITKLIKKKRRHILKDHLLKMRQNHR